MERQQAAMPPFGALALVRAEARSQEVAQAFLNMAREGALQAGQDTTHVTLYPAVPMAIQRIANVERAQMLVESPSRAALQRFLGTWHNVLQEAKAAPQCRGIIRWAIDVDPLAI